MSTQSLKWLLFKLRLIAIALLAALAVFITYSFRTGEQLAGDLWQQLGMTKAQGNEGIKNSFIRGYLYYYQAHNIRNIAAGDRLPVAKDLLQYAKQFVSSEAFKKEYTLDREQSKPVLGDTTVHSKEAIRKAEIQKIKESIADGEKSMKTLTPEMQKSVQPVIDMQKKNLEEYQKPDNPTIEFLYQAEKTRAADHLRDYQEALERWKEDYPADYRQKIKARLQAFLDLSATVDFNAQLKESGGRKRFVNPQYESQNTEWKQIFRAGKEVTDMTRGFVKEWIRELAN